MTTYLRGNQTRSSLAHKLGDLVEELVELSGDIDMQTEGEETCELSIAINRAIGVIQDALDAVEVVN